MEEVPRRRDTDSQAKLAEPPWDQPGCFRRDGMPHRGNFLRFLGFTSCFFGALAVVPFVGSLLGLLPLAFCLLIRRMARHDLAKMQTGSIDPRGRSVTEEADEYASIGLWISLGGMLFWALGCLCYLLFG